MTPEEIRKMRLEDTTDMDTFAVGDKVLIEDGPLKGFDGIVKQVNPMAKKATISTKMFDRETVVDLEFIQMKKIDPETPVSESDAN